MQMVTVVNTWILNVTWYIQKQGFNYGLLIKLYKINNQRSIKKSQGKAVKSFQREANLSSHLLFSTVWFALHQRAIATVHVHS